MSAQPAAKTAMELITELLEHQEGWLYEDEVTQPTGPDEESAVGDDSKASDP